MRVCHHCSVLDCWSLGPMIAPRTSPPQGGTLSMASRFPAPWRIVEILSGFAVEDACGQQLGVFYGRADPNIAGHTGFLTMDEARQMAVDFARLPELLKLDAPHDPAQRQAVSDRIDRESLAAADSTTSA